MTPIMHIQHRTKQKHNVCLSILMQLNEHSMTKFLYLGTWGSLWSTHCLQKHIAFVFCFVSHQDQEIISIWSSSTYSPA